MPLQSHSKPGSKYCVFSAYRLGKSQEDNNYNHNLLEAKLQQADINHKELDGRYDGAMEKSFISNMKDFDAIIDLAEEFNQETILLMDEPEAHGLRKAYIYYVKGGNKEYIGWLRSVSKERALRHDSYSYDVTQDSYFIVIKEREVFLKD